MTRYASNTSVSVEKSRAEIETLLARYGADQFMSGWNGSSAHLAFAIGRRMIRFELPLPSRSEKQFTHTEYRNTRRSGEASEKAWEQACRSRWRALLLVIKAKLEAVEVGISSIEREFLAWTVIPGDGRTVGEAICPQIEHAIQTGEKPQLLLSGGDGG